MRKIFQMSFTMFTIKIYNLTYEVTGLRNEGSIPLNEKNVKMVVLENTKSTYNRRGIVISKIKQDDVRYVRKNMVGKICSSYIEDDMKKRFIHAPYKICVEKSIFAISRKFNERHIAETPLERCDLRGIAI